MTIENARKAANLAQQIEGYQNQEVEINRLLKIHASESAPWLLQVTQTQVLFVITPQEFEAIACRMLQDNRAQCALLEKELEAL